MQGQPSTIHSLDQSHSTCTSWTPSSRHEVGVRILNSLWRLIELLRSVATLPPLLAGSSSKNHKTTPWDGARGKELTASSIQDRDHPGQTQHLTIRVCFVGRSRSNNRLRRSLSWRIGIGDRYSSLQIHRFCLEEPVSERREWGLEKCRKRTQQEQFLLSTFDLLCLRFCRTR
jgi:hypothetical protein